MNRPVIVGYDQTPSSEHALVEAAREADSRGTTLTIVHTYHWLTSPSHMALTPVGAEQATRETAEQVVDAAAQGVRDRRPGLRVETRVIAGSAPDALLEAGHGADLLVVGSRGHGGFVGLLLGSVSLRVLADTWCPVTVVRGDARPTRDLVLAAVDIDEPCDDLLEFAFATASRRGARLTVVHVWDQPRMPTDTESPGATGNTQAIDTDRRLRLDDMVRPWQHKYPDVHSTQRIGTGTTGRALVTESDSADLLVVGAHRRKEKRHGTHLGPVADTVLHHAACPVAVIPLS